MVKILAADIGGTNSRFALLEAQGDDLVMVDSIWLNTHGSATFAELLDQLWGSSFQAVPGGFDTAVLAVAGAIEQGGMVCDLPNAPWIVDLRDVDFGVPREKCFLINDFSAQAYACRTRAIDDALVIQPGQADPAGTIGVIGAGTGLGYSALFSVDGAWVAIPSEGGHMAFPFTGTREAEYEAFNRRESGRCWAEGDSVVTGLGLQLVHRFLTGEDKTPGEISDSVGPDSETVQWYARFYGRVCRNWAVAMMSHGGLFIAGGVAAKAPMYVQSPEFLKEFHNTHVYGDFLRSIPIKLNANEESGLFGAGFYALQRWSRP